MASVAPGSGDVVVKEWVWWLVIAALVAGAIIIFIYIPLKLKFGPAFGVYKRSRLVFIMFVVTITKGPNAMERVRHKRQRYVAAEVKYDDRLHHTRVLLKPHKAQSAMTWEDWLAAKDVQWIEAVFYGRPEELTRETTDAAPSCCSERKPPPMGGVYDLTWHDQCTIEAILVENPLPIPTYVRLRPDLTAIEYGKRKLKRAASALLGFALGAVIVLAAWLVTFGQAGWLAPEWLAALSMVASGCSCGTMLAQGWLRRRWRIWEDAHPRTAKELGFIGHCIEAIGPKTRRVGGYQVKVRAGHVDLTSEAVAAVQVLAVPEGVRRKIQEVQSRQAQGHASPDEAKKTDELVAVTDQLRGGIADLEVSLIQVKEALKGRKAEGAAVLDDPVEKKTAEVRTALLKLRTLYFQLSDRKSVDKMLSELVELRRKLDEAAKAVIREEKLSAVDAALVPDGLGWVTRVVRFDQLKRLEWLQERRKVTLDPIISVLDGENRLISIEVSVKSISAEVNDPMSLLDVLKANINARAQVIELEESLRAAALESSKTGAEYVRRIREVRVHLEQTLRAAMSSESDLFGGRPGAEDRLISVIEQQTVALRDLERRIEHRELAPAPRADAPKEEAPSV